MSELLPCIVENCDKARKRGDKLCSMHRARFARTGQLNLKTTEQRLLEKVHIDESRGCWEWTGYRNTLGYGRVRIEGKKELAHRVSYALFVGPITDSLLVCHHCDNPSCINPSHLFLGTNSDNFRDMSAKGRHWLQRAKKQGLRFRLNGKDVQREYQRITTTS